MGVRIIPCQNVLWAIFKTSLCVSKGKLKYVVDELP